MVFSVDEVRDIERINVRAHNLNPLDNPELTFTEDDVDSLKEEVNDGYIYRKKNEAVGYILFSPFGSDGNELPDDVLYVEHLAILPEERTPGAVMKVLSLLRQYASERGKKFIAWFAVSESMQHLNQRMGGQHAGADMTLPVEALNVEKLSELLKSQAVENA